MTQQSFITTKSLTKTYDTGQQQTTVISGLNLEIREGEFTVIMGSSGSGKSTLLYLLAGLDHVSGGEIWLKEQPIHQATEKQKALLRRKEIGFVFQDPSLAPNLTIRENILIAGYLSNSPKKQVQDRANELLRQVGMIDLANRLPSQLSGGQQQRAAIVRALINSPHILMADEPTGSLNSAASKAVLDIFNDFHLLGQTILMVTHEIKSACRGERILYFKDGRVIDELTLKGDLAAREQRLIQWLAEKGW